MGEKRRKISTEWLKRWGFAVLVAVALIASVLVAASVAMPSQVPSFALRASAIYRLETGAASFLGFYLAAMAVVLSLHNRGFTEIGMRGISARDPGGDARHRRLVEQEGVGQKMEKAIEEMETGEAD